MKNFKMNQTSESTGFIYFIDKDAYKERYNKSRQINDDIIIDIDHKEKIIGLEIIGAVGLINVLENATKKSGTV